VREASSKIKRMAGIVALAVVLALVPAGGAGAAVNLSPGDILVSDFGAEAVFGVDPSSGAQSTVPSAGSFKAPTSVAIEADGDILVAENHNFDVGLGVQYSRVTRVDPTTGAQSTVSADGFLNDVRDIAVEADGDILVVEPVAHVTDPDPFYNRGAVIRVDPTTGAQSIVAKGDHFANPVGIAVEADGDILVANESNYDTPGVFGGALIRVDPTTGAQSIVAKGGNFKNPNDVAVEADGDILVTDSSASAFKGAVIRVDPTTGAQSTVSSGGLLAVPSSIAIEADGDILVTVFPDQFGNGDQPAVIRVDPSSGAQSIVSSGGSFKFPVGIAVWPGVPNRAPVANDDSYTTDEDTPLNVAAPGVLGNDSDADGDPLTAALDSGPAHAASFTLNPDGSFDYTPAADYNGEDSFTYKTSDGKGGEDTATAEISVTAVNDAPTALVAAGGSCSNTTSVSGTMNLTVADVDSPIGGVNLSASSSSTTLVPNSNITFGGSGANRTVKITPTAKKSGSATITITSSEGAATSTTTIKVIVGTDKKESINGTSGTDMIFGLNGDDTINAGDGKDLVCGGNAGGVISGGAGDDTLDGGNGNDTLKGEDGNDILRGGLGNDRLEGGNNDDTLSGGMGADSFSGGPGTDSATDFNAAEGDTKDATIP
jgi:sugar lactone lactonase YvrE